MKYRSRTVTYIIPAGGQPERQMKFILREGHEPDLPEGAMDIRVDDWETLDETVPNLEVRLGAIYALERIAQDSERDHIPIMETLCAYIRENAPVTSADSYPLARYLEYTSSGNDDPGLALDLLYQLGKPKLPSPLADFDPVAWATTLRPPRIDIASVITVLGRRSLQRIEFEQQQEPPYRLDLRNSNLQGADLVFANFRRAVFECSALDGANCRGSKFDGVNFQKTSLVSTYFTDSSAVDCKFDFAWLHKTIAVSIDFGRSSFWECQFSQSYPPNFLDSETSYTTSLPDWVLSNWA